MCEYPYWFWNIEESVVRNKYKFSKYWFKIAWKLLCSIKTRTLYYIHILHYHVNINAYKNIIDLQLLNENIPHDYKVIISKRLLYFTLKNSPIQKIHPNLYEND